MNKRIVASLLSLLLIMSYVPSVVMADEISGDTEETGSVQTEEIEETEVSEETEAEVEESEPEEAEPEEKVEEPAEGSTKEKAKEDKEEPEALPETEVEDKVEVITEKADMSLASDSIKVEVNSVYYMNGSKRIYPDPDLVHNINDLKGDYDLKPGHYYYAKGNVTIDHRLYVKDWKDAVNLILCDGCTLTAKKGIGVIHVSDGNSNHESELRIWGQENDSGMLKASADDDYAAIGGGYSQNGSYKGSDGGSIEINGGIVQANAGERAAGIGGSYKHSNRYFTLNGGEVYAYGGGDTTVFVPFDWADYCGAGVGGGDHGNGGQVYINGGYLYAEGFQVSYSGVHSAGIGGGDHGNGADVVIRGGKVEVHGKGDSEGIGKGDDGSKSGSLSIPDNYSVYHRSWGSNDNSYKYSKKNDRIKGCRDAHVIIEQCCHNGAICINDDIKGHRFVCDYCDDKDFQALRPHEFTYGGGTCECGFEAGVPGKSASAEIMGYSLELKSDIGVNYYIKLNKIIAKDPDTFIKFILPDVNGMPQEIIMKISEGTYDKKTDCHVFKVNLPAKDMNSEIKANIHYKDQIVCRDTFTVRSYAEYIYRNPENESHKAVAAAMLNYGAAAQKYFGYKNRPANCNIDAEDQAVPQLTADELKKIGGGATEYYTRSDVPRLAGSSLVLKSKVTMKIFFHDDGNEHYFYDYSSRRMLDTTRSNGYIIAYMEVPADSLLINHHILIDNTKGGSYVDTCPERYVYQVLTGDYSKELKDLSTALYRYGEAVIAYRNSKAKAI